MNKNFEKVLALDFGTVRIGVALSFGTLAEPLKIIANDEKSLAEIQKIIANEHVKKIVFGVSENEMAEKTRAFAAQVQAVTNLPVEFFDETLSSYEVGQKLRELRGKNHRRENIDHLAAALILQGWLDVQGKDN